MTNRIKNLLDAKKSKNHTASITNANDKVWLGEGPEGRPLKLVVRLDVLLSTLTGFQLIDEEDVPLMIRVIEFISNDSIVCRCKTEEEIMTAAASLAIKFKSWIEVEHPVLADIGCPEINTWKEWLASVEAKVGCKELVVRPMPIEYCGWVPPTEIFA